MTIGSGEADMIMIGVDDLVLHRIHPQDRALAQQLIEDVSKSGTDFEHEYRLVMQSGAIKHVHVRAHLLRNSSDNIEFDPRWKLDEPEWLHLDVESR
jgi:hypothetical protein